MYLLHINICIYGILYNPTQDCSLEIFPSTWNFNEIMHSSKIVVLRSFQHSQFNQLLPTLPKYVSILIRYPYPCLNQPDITTHSTMQMNWILGERRKCFPFKTLKTNVGVYVSIAIPFLHSNRHTHHTHIQTPSVFPTSPVNITIKLLAK